MTFFTQQTHARFVPKSWGRSRIRREYMYEGILDLVQPDGKLKMQEILENPCRKAIKEE